ncbi:breast carcinoma-amplified sequence 1 isoform X3 [Ictalurus punctatus]|uniref:Breast carcinoma-amplified sequence 1 isoform X3 n=1 Tax=Ictalurus punctatus TaxID=7998 RepID=A0A9F7TR65_ICTPU|nr:breast carcinoma-amplified sequence 1 isoform X3 [Ictalurus punctatus]
MGNRQSVTITHPKAEHDVKHVKKDEANGHAIPGLDLTDAVTCVTSVQQNIEPPPVTVAINVKPTPASVEANGTKAKAPTVSVEAAGNQVSVTAVSAEQKIPAESSTPAKDTPKAETPSMFNKMFKKKTGPVSPASEANVAAEVVIVPEVQTDSQKSPTPASVEANGTKAKAPTVSVEAAGNQVSVTAVSAEQKIPAESSTPAKDTPKAETPSMFNKMFKKKTGPVSPASEANVAAEVVIVPEVQTDSQKSPTPASVEANGTKAKAPTVSVEAAGNQVSVTAVSAEQKIPAESSTPAKDTPKAETPSMFNKMFKKKTGPVSPASEANVAAEVVIVPEVQTDSQKSPTPASVEANGTKAKGPTVSVEAAGNQVSVTTVSAEQKIPAESSTPAKDTPKAETPSMFNKMFKKKTGPVSPASEANVAAEVVIVPEVQTDSQKSPTPASVEANGTKAKGPTVSVEAAGNQVSVTAVSAEQKIPAESSTPAKDTPKAETPSMFNKMFKKKTGPVSPASEANVAAEVVIVPEVQTDSQKSEPTDIKANTQTEKEPQGEAPKPSTTEVTQDSTQSEQTSTEEKSVMNFFKTLVTSTKTTKEATASPDVSKQQSQKETPPAPAANVQEASKIPPPPPPAPPKMESKVEPAVKKEEAPPIDVAAAAAKEPETPSKAKTKDSPFGKLFRTKVDASKTSTLEAGAKPEPAPAPKPEEKKAEKKPSPFANLLKPKVLLGQVSSKIHSAASSAAASISLGAGGAAAESKKEAPTAPTAPAEATPSTKAKEEPKPAAVAAAPAAASPDNKSVGSTDNSSPSTSRKLEKRNSIHLFFKSLGQKRHSDAGVQTEPVAQEKAK